MAKINGIIPMQNYELIRDRIGSILFVELANQADLNNTEKYNPTVWVERSVPFDKTELPALNVRFNSIDFSNKDIRSVDGSQSFFIDVYTSSPYEEDSEGDKEATITLHRIMGLVRAILQNPQYKTLDFALPFLSNTMISRMFVGEADTKDALSTMVGRIEFTVRCQENVQLIDAPMLGSHFTQVFLADTDKGYRWEYVNEGIQIFVLENGNTFISEINNNFFIKN